jgi:sarcosine oxidase subunit gamma
VTADALARSPLAHRSDDLAAFAAGTGGTVSIAEVPFLAQVGLRADATAATGLAVPLAPNTVRAEGSRSTLWLGPDEWLITGLPGTTAAIIQDLDAGLGERPHACVDLSANRVVLDLGGPGALEVLERGCSLDLHPSRWAAGMCAQTNLARAQIILEQRPEATRLFVRPSFADYLVDWLVDWLAA